MPHPKGIGDQNREIEAREQCWIALGIDELTNIRMIAPEDRHVRSTAHALGSDHIARRIEDPNERDRTGRRPARRAHEVTPRAQVRERESCTPTSLLNLRGIANRTEDSVQRVWDWQDETGKQLSQLRSGIDQCRGVGQKAQGGHELVKLLCHFIAPAPLRKGILRRRHRSGDAPEQLLLGFDDATLFVTP